MLLLLVGIVGTVVVRVVKAIRELLRRSRLMKSDPGFGGTIELNHFLESSEGKLILEEAHTCSETGIGLRMDSGQFSSIQASTSLEKNFKSSSMLIRN